MIKSGRGWIDDRPPAQAEQRQSARETCSGTFKKSQRCRRKAHNLLHCLDLQEQEDGERDCAERRNHDEHGRVGVPVRLVDTVINELRITGQRRRGVGAKKNKTKKSGNEQRATPALHQNMQAPAAATNHEQITYVGVVIIGLPHKEDDTKKQQRHPASTKHNQRPKRRAAVLTRGAGAAHSATQQQSSHRHTHCTTNTNSSAIKPAQRASVPRASFCFAERG